LTAISLRLKYLFKHVVWISLRHSLPSIISDTQSIANPACKITKLAKTANTISAGACNKISKLAKTANTISAGSCNKISKLTKPANTVSAGACNKIPKLTKTANTVSAGVL
jgi:hypothetical protein